MPGTRTRSALFALLATALAISAWGTGATKPSSSESDDPDAGYRRIFRRLDADGDGAVTEAEYVSRTRWPEGKARAIWRASDANGDGKVTEAEYCRNRRVTDKAKEVFAWIDADRSGKLTEAELVATAKRIFETMDKDRSGEVTIPEYLGTRWEWDVTVDFLRTPRRRERAGSAPAKPATGTGGRE